MKLRALLALLLMASCSRPAPKPPAATPAAGKAPVDDSSERSSLLDITHGASIVSRTGEAALLTSAINTIDGDSGSFWAPPPHDYPQSIVIALGAPSRIDRIGLRSPIQGGSEANHVTFERSLDGAAWQPLATLAPRHLANAQWFNVAPSDAAFLRVTIPEPKDAGRDARIQSLYAHGTELEAPHDAPLDGCWSINGNLAAFTQHGARATGIVGQRAQPVFLAGGTNGRIWRFNWIHGNDFGYTVLAVSPGSRNLSALNWHEEAIPLFAALPWFGERAACGGPIKSADVPIALLRRAGRVSLFALQFDATGMLLADASHEELQTLVSVIRVEPSLRIVAHEFRETDDKRNRLKADREIGSLREALTHLGLDLGKVAFVAAGSSDPRQVPATDAARAIYSSIEVEVRR